MSRNNVCPQAIDAENVVSFFRRRFAFGVLTPAIFFFTPWIAFWTAPTETFFVAVFFLTAGFFAMNSSSFGCWAVPPHWCSGD
jgi:hypothetical protein